VVTLDVPRDQVQNYGVVVADGRGGSVLSRKSPVPRKRCRRRQHRHLHLRAGVLDLVPPASRSTSAANCSRCWWSKELPFFAQKRFFNWIDIGRLSDYWMVLQRVLRGEIAQMEMPGTQVRPGVWVGLNTSVDWDSVQIEGPVYIGSNTRIEAGARVIGPTWIGHGSHLPPGCTVERSVLFEYTRIGTAQIASERIMSPQYCVDRHGNTLYVGDEVAPLVWGDARA
jgi:mannose-1-phosphate guanylyltransferase